MALFLSTYINKIDKKGRVSVPALYRSTLAQTHFQGFIAFRSYKSLCVEGCDISRMEKLSQSVDQLDLFSDEQDDLTSVIFSDSRQISFDQDGRVILPEDLCEYAKIENHVSFVGRGPTFQIWNPEIYKQHQQDARERLIKKKTTIKMVPEAESSR